MDTAFVESVDSSEDQIFVQQLLRDRLPIGTEVAKRHGRGDDIYLLSVVLESGTHIFFSYPIARFLWSLIHGTP